MIFWYISIFIIHWNWDFCKDDKIEAWQCLAVILFWWTAIFMSWFYDLWVLLNQSLTRNSSLFHMLAAKDNNDTNIIIYCANIVQRIWLRTYVVVSAKTSISDHDTSTLCWCVSKLWSPTVLVQAFAKCLNISWSFWSLLGINISSRLWNGLVRMSLLVLIPPPYHQCSKKHLLVGSNNKYKPGKIFI